MSSWPMRRLGDLVLVRGGKRLPKGVPFAEQTTPHRYLTLVDLSEGARLSEGHFLDEATYRKIARYTINASDVYVTIVGANVGVAGMVAPKFSGANLTENAARLTVIDHNVLDPKFLCSFLQLLSSLEMMKAVAGGAAQPKLALFKIENFPLPVPPITTQRKVACIFSTLDNLIDNNTRRIEIFEAMAQAIYREWFIEIRYPGYNSVPLVGSERGPIPDSWTLGQLHDAVSFDYGKALKASVRRGGSVAVYGSGGVVGWHDTALVEGPGIVVGRKGNVGSVHWSDRSFFPIDTTYFVRTRLPLTYVYFALRDLAFIDSHAAVPGLSREQAYALPFLVPEVEVALRFDEMVSPIFKLRRLLLDANDNLRATRDLLLPRLISGEIDVSNLDIDVRDAAA